MIARFCDVQDRQGLGRLAGGHEQSSETAFECCDAILDSGLGRVHDAGVDIAQFLQREQVRRMRRVIEDVRGGHVNRQCTGVGGRVRRLAGMDLESVERPGVAHENSY